MYSERKKAIFCNNQTRSIATRVSSSYLCVFFFQAEDGIRDGRVTGVQTCALPICLSRPENRLGFASLLELLRTSTDVEVVGASSELFRLGRELHAERRIRTRLELCRSEERRVGKECRSRWSP